MEIINAWTERLWESWIKAMVVINKIIAPNPGPFTGEGTNTYLIGKNDITLVDPGPAINSHIDKAIPK